MRDRQSLDEDEQLPDYCGKCGLELVQADNLAYACEECDWEYLDRVEDEFIL